MRGVLAALQWINLFTVAIAAGGQLFVLWVIIPARRTWPAELAVRLHQDILTTRPDRYLRPSMATSIVTGVVLALLEREGWPTLLTVLGVLGGLGTAVVSYRWEFPINAQINAWAQGPVPDTYPTLRATWDEKHRWRTAFGLLALASFLAAAVLRQGAA